MLNPGQGLFTRPGDYLDSDLGESLLEFVQVGQGKRCWPGPSRTSGTRSGASRPAWHGCL